MSQRLWIPGTIGSIISAVTYCHVSLKESKLNKVLIYIGGLSSCEKGAVGTHTRGIINAFMYGGQFSSHYIVGSNLDCFATNEKLLKRDISHLGVPTGSVLHKFKFFKRYADTILEEIAFIIKEHPDSEFLVYHRYSVSFSLRLFKQLKKSGHVKLHLILEYNDITVDQLKFASVNKQWNPVSSFIRTNILSLRLIEQQEGRCFNLADRVVCVTDKLKAYADSLSGNTNAIVIENATEKSLIEKYYHADKVELRKKLHLDPSKFYLCHVGTLTYWDGLIELFHSLKKIRSINHLRFIIIGDGALKIKLRQLAEELNLLDTILFYDAMPFDQAIEFVYIADMIPLLKTITSYQLSPIKYYESLGLGKFILSSDTPYINRAANEQLGQTVSLPLDTDEIANQLDALYQRREEINGMGTLIKEYAMKHHTWNSRVEAILSSLKTE